MLEPKIPTAYWRIAAPTAALPTSPARDLREERDDEQNERQEHDGERAEAVEDEADDPVTPSARSVARPWREGVPVVDPVDRAQRRRTRSPAACTADQTSDGEGRGTCRQIACANRRRNPASCRIVGTDLGRGLVLLRQKACRYSSRKASAGYTPRIFTSVVKKASSSRRPLRPGSSGCPSTSARNWVAVKCATDHVALQLGHVDAVGREPAQRLVERGRQVAHVEDEARDDRAVAPRGLGEVAGEHDEPRGVVVLVLHVLLEHLEPVGLGRQRRRDRGLGEVTRLRHLAGGAGRVARDHRRQAVLADHLAALARARGRGCAPCGSSRSWRRAGPSARTGCAGSARRRCAGRSPAGSGGCRPPGPRSSCRSGSSRGRRPPPSTTAKTSSKDAHGTGSRSA